MSDYYYCELCYEPSDFTPCDACYEERAENAKADEVREPATYATMES